MQHRRIDQGSALTSLQSPHLCPTLELCTIGPTHSNATGRNACSRRPIVRSPSHGRNIKLSSDVHCFLLSGSTYSEAGGDSLALQEFLLGNKLAQQS